MDYSKCVIYKLVCNDLTVTDCYVGHTTNFTQRKKLHKSCCNCETSNNYNLKVYQTIRANSGWENWSMIEIEKFPCKDFNEAAARERYWYEQLKVNLNMCVPNRSKKEYSETHKEEFKQYHKEYYKKYEEENKEELKAKRKEYREENKEKILEKMKEKFTCECGGKYSYCHKSRHFKSKKHQDFISSNNKDASSITETEEIINV
jgi:hypothetical protein